MEICKSGTPCFFVSILVMCDIHDMNIYYRDINDGNMI